MDDGPVRKRQRLAAADQQQQAGPPAAPAHPEGPPDAPAVPVNWDFLLPWCEELRSRLLMADGYVRVLREKRSSARIDFEASDEEEEAKEDESVTKALLAASYVRTREALELLTLVAHVDKSAWHLLLTKRCGLRLDDEESDDDEEGESVDDEEEGFLLFTDDEDDEAEAESDEDDVDDRGGEHDSESGESSDEDEDEDVTVDLSRNASNLERERDLPMPQFDFITIVSEHVERKRTVRPPLEEWKALFLTETSHSQSSAAYRNAKARLLAMQATGTRAQPQIGRVLEIPVSLELGLWPPKQGHATDHLQELAGFIRIMQSQAQKLEDRSSMKADTAFVYRLRRFSLLSCGSQITELFATRLLAVLESDIPVMELGLSLNAQSKHDDDKKSTREALAKLLNGILLRQPDPGNEKSGAIASLQIDCDTAHTWQFKALCSAIAVARTPIAKVRLSRVCEYRSNATVRRADWRALTHALFRTRSCKGDQFPSVRGLELPDVAVTTEDLAEIAAVLREKEHHETIAGSQEICRQRWMVREGTVLQVLHLEAEEESATASKAVTLAFDTCVQLMEEHPDEKLDADDSDWLDVIVPAYGECRVPRTAVIAVSADEIEERGEPLRSLSLTCKTEADGLGGLLELVGWSLHSLSLTLHREIDANALVPTILSSCSLLTKLELNECDIDLDNFATAYEQIGDDSALAISSLAFQDICGVGEGNGLLFAQQLGDPTSRLARHLRTLSILVDEYTEPLDDQVMSQLWVALGKNHKLEKLKLMASRPHFGTDWKKAFRRFHGEELLPRPLADNLKLAFLSVARGSGGEDDSSLQSAAQRLDRRALSLIFEFAATRVIRSAKVYSEL